MITKISPACASDKILRYTFFAQNAPKKETEKGNLLYVEKIKETF